MPSVPFSRLLPYAFSCLVIVITTMSGDQKATQGDTISVEMKRNIIHLHNQNHNIKHVSPASNQRLESLE